MYLCAPLEKLTNRKDTEARKRKGKGERGKEKGKSKKGKRGKEKGEKVYPKANGLEAFSVGHRPTGKKVGHHPPKKHLRLSAGNNLESEIRNPTFEIYNCD